MCFYRSTKPTDSGIWHASEAVFRGVEESRSENLFKTGKKRDPYVLRHTCAMNALNAEMTVKALADKMRTSV